MKTRPKFRQLPLVVMISIWLATVFYVTNGLEVFGGEEDPVRRVQHVARVENRCEEVALELFDSFLKHGCDDCDAGRLTIDYLKRCIAMTRTTPILKAGGMSHDPR